jgi:hypothetical protein
MVPELTRRKALATAGIAGATVLAGCGARESTDDVECHGECWVIGRVTVNSHSGFDSYTNVTISFTEPVESASLTVEVYREGSLVGVEDVDLTQRTTGAMVEFDEYRTDTTEGIALYVHEVEGSE